MKLLDYFSSFSLFPRLSTSLKQSQREAAMNATMSGRMHGVNGANGSQSLSPGKIWQRFGEVDSSSFADDGERIQALLATYAMLSRLETPWETIVRLSMGQVIAV